MKKWIIALSLLVMTTVSQVKSVEATEYFDDITYPRYSYDSMLDFMKGYKYYYTGDLKSETSQPSRVITGGYYGGKENKIYDIMSGSVASAGNHLGFSTSNRSLNRLDTTLNFRMFFENSALGYTQEDIERNPELMKVKITGDPSPGNIGYYPNNVYKVTFLNDSGGQKSVIIPTTGVELTRPGADYTHMVIEGSYRSSWGAANYTSMKVFVEVGGNPIYVPKVLASNNGRDDIDQVKFQADFNKGPIDLGEIEIGKQSPDVVVPNLVTVIGGQTRWRIQKRDITYNPDEGVILLSLNNYNDFSPITQYQSILIEGQKGFLPYTVKGTFRLQQGEYIKVGKLNRVIEYIGGPIVTN